MDESELIAGFVMLAPKDPVPLLLLPRVVVGTIDWGLICLSSEPAPNPEVSLYSSKSLEID